MRISDWSSDVFSSDRRFDDVPAIGGGFGVVDDQRGGGALAGRLLIFVCPAAVIGHRAAVELALGLLGLPVGIVDEDDDRLPLHIDPGIVVPALFGRVDAVSDEDDVAVLDRDFRLDAIGGGAEVGAVFHAHGLLADGGGPP